MEHEEQRGVKIGSFLEAVRELDNIECLRVILSVHDLDGLSASEVIDLLRVIVQ